MDFLYTKGLHIIFVVTWFSGMFYLCRLFVYNTEALKKPDVEKQILQKQYNLMIRRLLIGITWPSAILTLIFGLLLLLNYAVIPMWLYIKLGFVLLLLAYQFSLHHLYKQQKKYLYQFSSNQLRIWNEVPTVLLVSIVFLVVVKQNLSWVYGLTGLVAFSLVLLGSIKLYKKLRERQNEP